MAATTDPERVRIWSSLRAAHALMEQVIIDDLLRERAVELVDFELLAKLIACGGTARTSDLCRELVMSKSNMSRLVDRVEYDGLVARSRDVEDTRVVHVAITRDGRDEYRRVLPAYQRSVQRAVAAISDSDIVAVNRSMHRVAERLHESAAANEPTRRY
jgi:DNA-binding MarR family transcriptional regulator